MIDLDKLILECEDELALIHKGFDEVSYKNTTKVLNAFVENRISAAHFTPTDGYGYGDLGREKCDRLFADIFEAESGFARHNFVSGTHALSVGLFGLLRPNETMLCVTGLPYDTIHSVIGIGKKIYSGSLAEFGIQYKQTKGFMDIDEIIKELQTDKTIKLVYIQRSRGYNSKRNTLSVAQIGVVCDAVKSVSDAFVMVDNCYGEFCEEHEPPFVGVDLTVGSLIKNPGGGIAESGGYIVGTELAVDKVAQRLTAPGLGLDSGASLGHTKPMIKGLFFAPHVVAQALKSASLTAMLFTKLGYDVSPTPFEDRYDIIQTVNLESPEKVCAFCEGLQSMSPIDSSATPVPSEMPGYDDPVIMAAGAFTQGASIELSADAPMRPPYCVFLQGGLTYESAKIAIKEAAKRVIEVLE